MNVYLKKMCLTIAESLKRQRGNQYGFGDDPDSWDHVEKNLTEELLDDPDITTTKPIENFFGNLDRELRKTGSHGFDKAGDDLVIKYSKDLIQTDEFQWRTKANKQKAKELKSMQVAFIAQQKAQVALTANEEEAVLLNSQNRVLQCIQSCKEKHGGPIRTKGALHSMVTNWESSEKALDTSLNLEIHLRKLTFTKVKASCPLFKQMKLSIDEKVRNLESLIESQLDLRTLAEMEDLESAIREDSSSDDNAATDNVQAMEELNVSGEESCLYKEGEFIVGLFTSGIYPGEVTRTYGDMVTADFLIPANVRQSNEQSRFWKRSSEDQAEKYEIHKNSVLPIRPVLSLSKYSTNRTIIYDLVNVDLIMKFV